MAQMAERDETCWCTHSGHDHDAGECWAEVTTTEGAGQCGCNWWEPIADRPPRDTPPSDWAVIRSVGEMCRWRGESWRWDGRDWQPATR